MRFERGKDPKETLRIGKHHYSQIEVESYTTPPHNLCSSEVVLKLGDQRWELPKHSLSSGGSVSFDENWSEEVTEGPWSVNEWPEGFPEEAKPYALEAINKTVPWGCCGGCV